MGLFNKKHSVGKTIAMLRKEKGWTQVELADKLQVSDKAVSKWEQDDAFPSMEFFPALAELFGVSIDYLMTGKKVEPEILAISKAELCAKNDDVSMVNKINLCATDENGKTIIDYIVKYESYKVFSAICDKKEFIDLQNSHNRSNKKFDALTLIKFALITNAISVLDRTIFVSQNCIADDIKSLLHVNDPECLVNIQGLEKRACIITDEILDIIVLDKRVDQDTISYLLSNQKDRECVWYLVLPYLLHQSYLHNNIELFNRILNASISSNQYAYDKMPIKYDSYYGNNYDLRNFMIASKSGYGNNKVHGLVRALEKTIKLALERSDIETVEKLNKLNKDVMNYHSRFECYIANLDEIRVAKLKLDKSISKEDLMLQSAIHENVLSIDELLETNNFKLIKKALNNYPVHIIEHLYSLFTKKDWRQLFEYAVDNNNSAFVDAIMKMNEKSILRYIEAYWKENINKKHLFYTDNGKNIELFTKIYSMQQYRYSTIEDAINKLQLCKQRIIDELSLKIDTDKIIGELTKEYFESELEKGNEDIVIIKLCVRLEAVLRCNYKYSGDFSAMLNQYCKEKLCWSEDDGWGYSVNRSDDKTIKLLNNLRMKRNSIVHSEKTNIELSKEDIKYCIDYICKLG